MFSFIYNRPLCVPKSIKYNTVVRRVHYSCTQLLRTHSEFGWIHWIVEALHNIGHITIRCLSVSIQRYLLRNPMGMSVAQRWNQKRFVEIDYAGGKLVCYHYLKTNKFVSSAYYRKIAIELSSYTRRGSTLLLRLYSPRNYERLPIFANR